MFPKKIIRRLQEVRLATFPTYNKITFDHHALKILGRLFINPDCQADIDLATLKGARVKLSRIGEHIITAAPATLAQYAERRGITYLRNKDVLRCFALDHAHVVRDNRIETRKNKRYALAHILHVSTVTAMCSIADKTVVNAQSTLAKHTIIFKNIVVPPDIPARIGRRVYHHFGVVVALANDEKFAKEIQKFQAKNAYLARLIRSFKQKNIIIDFTDKRIFSKDVCEQILFQRTSRIKKPGDIVRGKITFKR